MQLLWVGIGGALGSVLRFLFQTRFQGSWGSGIPLGTLGVNLIGSFIIGFVGGWFLYAPFSNSFRVFLMVGILGGFTTFSSFTLENLTLIREGNLKAAALYILASNVLGIGLAFAGFLIARALGRSSGL